MKAKAMEMMDIISVLFACIVVMMYDLAEISYMCGKHMAVVTRKHIIPALKSAWEFRSEIIAEGRC